MGDNADGTRGREVELRPAPHDGFLFLQNPRLVGPRSWSLLHSATLEQRVVPNPVGSWSLYFQQGFGALVDDESDQVLLAEELLQRQLCFGSDGERYIVETKGGVETTTSLRERQARFRTCRGKVFVGPTGAEHSITVYHLLWPRQGGFRFCWRAACIYRILALSSYKKQASKWAWNSAPGWDQRCTELGFSGQVVSSSSSLRASSPGDDADGFLPAISLTTLALLEFLARASVCTPNEGGLRDPRAKAAAACLLDALIGNCMGSRRKRLDLTFEDDFIDSWPVRSGCDLSLPVSEGRVQLSEWRRMVSEGQNALSKAIKWWEHCQLARVGDEIELVSLLRRAANYKPGTGFVTQVVYQVAAWVEQGATQAMQGKGGAMRVRIEMAYETLLDSIDDPNALNSSLLKHVLAGRRASERSWSISLASDKAAVCGLSLDFGAFVTPSNVCSIAVPQVAKAFSMPDEVGSFQAGVAAKRMNLRHLHWLKRHTTTSKKNMGWRPRKRYRISTRHWILAKDNMLKVCTRFNGLQAFARGSQADDAWSRASWKTWPHLNLAQDQGPDGFSAVMALKYKPELKCNITEWWDESHGIHNDVLNTYKKFGLFPFVLVTMCVLNLAHGPERERDMRFNQMQEVLAMIFQVFRPDTCSTFMAHAPRMLEQLKSEMDLGSHDSQVECLWEFLRSRAPFTKQERRVNLCRFLSWVKAAPVLLKEWDALLWKLEVLCIEMDFVQGSKYMHKLGVQRQALRQAEELNTTSSAVPSVDARAIRSACQNIAVVSLTILQDYRNRRLTAIMAHTMYALDRAHGAANHQCRSAIGCRDFVVGQVQGGFLSQLREIFGVLRSEAALADCEFEMGGGKGRSAGDAVLGAEDEWATLFGDMCMRLVANRTARKLWSFGWPHRLCMLLRDGGFNDCLELVRAFKADFETWEYMKGLSDSNQTVSKLLGRSQFQCTSVQQFVAALSSSGWAATPEVRELVSEHFSGIMSSQLVEDCFGAAKNAAQVRGSKLFRRPERSMAVTLATEVPSKRHRYTMCEPDVALPSKSARLDPAAFGKVPATPTLDLQGIVTTQAKATYFSPKPGHSGVPVADLALCRECRELGCFNIARWAGLSCMSDCGRFVFKRISDDGLVHDVNWHLGLASFPDSAALTWQVVLRPIPGYAEHLYLDFQSRCAEPEVFPIFDWSRLVGRQFVWRSPASLRSSFPNAPVEWQQQVQAVVVGRPDMAIEEIAAEQAWWDLDIASLRMVAEHLNINLPTGCSLLVALLTLTMSVSNVSEEVAMGMLGRRFASVVSPDNATDELLQLEDAAKLLNREDEQELEKAQAKQKQKAVDHGDFVREYKEKKVTLRSAGDGAKNKSAGQRSRKPVTLPPPDILDLPSAKKMMPPGAFVWRAWSHEAWEGRLPPFGTVSRGWRRAGSSSAALHSVVVELWKRHCELEGLESSDCPVRGVFDVSDAGAGSSGGAASSSA